VVSHGVGDDLVAVGTEAELSLLELETFVWQV
jgi:hypothetical protein